MWRKRRVRDKRNLDTAAALDRVENRVLWEDPPPLYDTREEGIMHALRERRPGSRERPRDDYQQLLNFSASLFGELHESFLELSLSMLPAEFSAHLREKVPREKFESTYRWVAAVKKEIDTALLPMVRDRAPKHKAYFETAAAFLTGDRMLEDLGIEERLETAIDRAMKRYQLKLARQLDRPNVPALVESKAPKQLDGPATIVPKVEE